MDLVSFVVVLLTTLSAIIAGCILYGMSNLHEIKEDWVKYRCNPIYMPLAGMVGSDVLSNFMHCTMQSVNTYAGFALDPIYANFSILQSIVSNILSAQNFIRQKVVGTADAFLGIVNSVFGKIQNTLSVSGQLIGRIRTIMARMISVFVVLVNVVTTGMDTGQSVLNGPIGQAANFLCFDPFTPVQLQDGPIMPMRDIKNGDVLIGNHTVRTTMMFKGTDTAMVDLMGTRVSANHKVIYKNEWIRAEEHPDALPTDSVPFLVCLTTDTHQIPVRDHIFKDYEETDNTAEFNQSVAVYYGSEVSPQREQYSVSGFLPTSYVVLSDTSKKLLKDVRIGDNLFDGGEVIGILRHSRSEPYIQWKGVYMLKGTLVRKGAGIVLAADIGTETDMKAEAIQLLTERATVVLAGKMSYVWALDDQEVPCNEIHATRDAQVCQEKVVGL
jgi:hypothetical protein